MTGQAWYWLILQLAAIAGGIYLGIWIFEAVST